ncbi:MAG: aldehyde dehydrogenase PuuC, partial [Steroidobacteraceae bacterium]
MNDSQNIDALGWQARARAARPSGSAFINGAAVAAHSGATFDCISPIDGRRLAAVAACDRLDVDAAVAAARASFD